MFFVSKICSNRMPDLQWDVSQTGLFDLRRNDQTGCLIYIF